MTRWSLPTTDQLIGRYLWAACFVGVAPIVIAEARDPQIVFATWDFFFDSQKLVNPMVAFLLAPWVEALFIACILHVLKHLVRPRLALALTLAVLWTGLHLPVVISQRLPAVEFGLCMMWTAFVLSLCFLEWEKKSTVRAIVFSALVLTCQGITILPPTIYLLNQGPMRFGPYQLFGFLVPLFLVHLT